MSSCHPLQLKQSLWTFESDLAILFSSAGMVMNSHSPLALMRQLSYLWNSGCIYPIYVINSQENIAFYFIPIS
ncbi:hypothetical protein RchiOBHm_Chr5g0006671 [Rosa chinensis]|uniref:Uncharacterized protein n=1 Tax=Rosa chinensis TaxID=74649 RepID=A0A2P6Q3L9_ROSCH|nr:hypothetical protein RchiOBHm_Chr5g0006671 [Rosa chinensis]